MIEKLKIAALDEIMALRAQHTGDMYGAYVRSVLDDYEAKVAGYNEQQAHYLRRLGEATDAFNVLWAERPDGPHAKIRDVMQHLDVPPYSGFPYLEKHMDLVDLFRIVYLRHHVAGYV